MEGRSIVDSYIDLFKQFETNNSYINKRIESEKNHKEYLKMLIKHYCIEIRTNHPSNEILLFLENEIKIALKSMWANMFSLQEIHEEKEFSIVGILDKMKSRSPSEGYNTDSIKLTETFLKKFKHKLKIGITQGKIDIDELSNLYDEYKSTGQNSQSKKEVKEAEEIKTGHVCIPDRVDTLLEEYFTAMSRIFENSEGTERERNTRNEYEENITKLLKQYKNQHMCQSDNYPLDTLTRNKVAGIKAFFETQGKGGPLDKAEVKKVLEPRPPAVVVPRKQAPGPKPTERSNSKRM